MNHVILSSTIVLLWHGGTGYDLDSGYEFHLFENFGLTKDLFLRERMFQSTLTEIKAQLELRLKALEHKSTTLIELESQALTARKNSLNETTAIFPDRIDYDGAVYAMVVLKDTYDFDVFQAAQGLIDIEKFANGQPLRMESPHKLDYKDLKKMADVALKKMWYDTSIKFLKGVFEVIATLPEAQRPVMSKYESMRRSLVKVNNEYITKKMIMAGANYKVLPYVVDANLERKKKQPKVLRENQVTLADMGVQSAREYYLRAVCNGFSFRSYFEPPPRFRCAYLHHQDPYLRLGPFKVEMVSTNPYLVVFQDLFTQKEMDHLLIESTPHLTRTRKPELKNEGQIHEYKSGKKRRIVTKTVQHWLSDLVYEDKKVEVKDIDDNYNYTIESKVLFGLSQKLERATRLNITHKYSSTQYQVTNYGLAGLCETHVDPHGSLEGVELPPSRLGLRKSGDMFATIMGWIQDEPVGGATAFVYPHKEVLVWPTKGAAAYWYDLDLKGFRNRRTVHGGCPILKGSKWIVNKWIFYFDQSTEALIRSEIQTVKSMRELQNNLAQLSQALEEKELVTPPVKEAITVKKVQISNLMATFPEEQTIVDTAKGLLMVMDTYRIQIDALTKRDWDFLHPLRGRVRLVNHQPMGADDTLTLAFEAFKIGWYDHAANLTRFTREHLSLASFSPHQRIHLERFTKDLVRTHNELLRRKKTIVGEGFKLLPYLVDGNLKKKSSQPKFLKREDFFNRDPPEVLNQEYEKKEDVMRRICRGEIVGAEVKNQVRFQRCHWLHHNNPFLRLAPFKMEVLLKSPFRMILHEILNEDEIQWLMDYSTPNLSRERGISPSNLKLTKHDRVAGKRRRIIHKTVQCWIEDVMFNATLDAVKDSEGIWKLEPFQGDPYASRIFSPTIHKLSKKIEQATNMILTERWSSTKYQVTNYGLGGLCESHIDPHGIWEGAEIPPGSRFLHSTGDMLATFMAWLNDVKAGGLTAFDSEGYEQTVIPTRGSAAFWINLATDLRREALSSHGGCPVLAGSKMTLVAVMSVWIAWLGLAMGGKYEFGLFENFVVTEEVFKNEINLIQALKHFHRAAAETPQNNEGQISQVSQLQHLARLKFELTEKLKPLEKDFGTLEVDFDGAITGLLVLKETYNLPMKDFLRGKVVTNGLIPQEFQSPYHLNVQDILFLAVKANEKRWYDAAVPFMREVFNSALTFSPAEKDQFAKFQPQIDRLKVVIKQSQNHYLTTRRAPFGQDYRVLPYLVDDNLEKLKKQPKFVRQMGPYKRNITNPNEYLQGDLREEAERRVCRGELVGQKVKDEGPQSCYHLHNQNPYLRIAPFKMEVLLRRPFRMILHDFMSEAEMAWLLEYSKPRLSRSREKVESNKEVKKNNLQNKKIRIISKTTQTWIGSRVYHGDDEFDQDDQLVPNPKLYNYTDTNPMLVSLSRKIERATKMKLLSRFSATDYQVTNYGLSGLCEGHIDPHGYLEGMEVPASRRRLFASGDIFATFMAWLDDVDAGGGTGFESPGFEQVVWPTRGSAAFWIDLRPLGHRELRSSHTGCPILKGSKWILNKWIYLFDQFHHYKCGTYPNDEFRGLFEGTY
eukprot:snap_masked-scaffold359_size197282-processed-gene-0.4 protein:Tk01280 transcript:snap_masked-scaffold359_size197282-processed-gene-0.4-mRNA-1 annotation:"prolyl 4-hydroxylase subunit alpha-1"